MGKGRRTRRKKQSNPVQVTNPVYCCSSSPSTSTSAHSSDQDSTTCFPGTEVLRSYAGAISGFMDIEKANGQEVMHTVMENIAETIMEGEKGEEVKVHQALAAAAALEEPDNEELSMGMEPEPPHQHPQESAVFEEIHELRGRIVEALEEVMLMQLLPNERGHLLCPFLETGCAAKFETKEELLSHSTSCFYGIFQFCKQTICHNGGRGEIHQPLHVFSAHTAEDHDCVTVHNCLELSDVDIMFPHYVWEVNNYGYHLSIVRRVHFMIEDMEVGMLVGIIVQDIGLDFKRVILAPLVYDVNTREKLNHIIDVECSFVGRDEFELMPMSYPGFNERNVLCKINSRAFVSTASLVEAAGSLDGVLSYASHTLRDQAISIESSDGGFDILYLNLKLNPLRCVVKQDKTKFPPIQFASIWGELRLHPEVVAIMDDGEYDRPTEISGALVPQLHGQSDVIVECMYESLVYNAVMAAIFNTIVDQRLRPKNPPTSILAWVLLPTVSLLRNFVADWKPRAMNLQISMMVMESPFQEIKEQIKRVGAEIIVTLPTALHETIKSVDPKLNNVLIGNVKHVFLPAHHRNCFPDNRAKLQFLMDQLNVYVNGTIKIAYTPSMHKEMQNHSMTLRKMEHKKEKSAIFPNGWNMISLGPDPKRNWNDLILQYIFYYNYNERNSKIVDLISSFQHKMRWLIIDMNGIVGHDENILGDLLAVFDERWNDTSKVKCITQETEIMINSCSWDPFLHREDFVMIGPYFLIDCPQSQDCDALILLTEPIYDAEYLRIMQIVTTQVNAQKLFYICSRAP